MEEHRRKRRNGTASTVRTEEQRWRGHTAVVGIDVLLELLQGAQANHRTTAEPEGGHGSELLMQTDQEVMETAPAHDVLQVPVPEGQEDRGLKPGKPHGPTRTLRVYWDLFLQD